MSPTSYSFMMEMQDAEGKWAPMIESTLTKSKKRTERGYRRWIEFNGPTKISEPCPSAGSSLLGQCERP